MTRHLHRLAALHEVRDKGAPAQAARARELLQALDEDADDPQAPADADALIEAYLHDPYLTKNDGN